MRTRAQINRAATIAAVTGAVTILAAGPAAAAVTPTDSGTELTFTSDGAGDIITFACNLGGFVTPSDGSPLSCASVTSAEIHANAGSDTVNLSGVTAAAFPALKRVAINVDGAEADVVNGTQLADQIDADNQDTIVAGGGDDFIDGGESISGGEGNDVLYKPGKTADGGPGDDRIVNPSQGPFLGGDGFDTFEADFTEIVVVGTPDLTLTVTGSSLTVSSSAAPPQAFSASGFEAYEVKLPEGLPSETWDSTAFPGRVVVWGQNGHDALASGPGDDHLNGGVGPDTLTPGAGHDVVYGGADNDTINVRDGLADRVDCGAGSDTVTADRADVLVGCETVSVPPPVTGKIVGPKQVVKGKKATFRFTSDAPGSTFECKIDKGKFKPCKSPFKLATTKLKKGKHTLLVRASQPAGNVDATPSKKSFKVV